MATREVHHADMRRFAELCQALDAPADALAQVEAMRAYFQHAPAADAAWELNNQFSTVYTLYPRVNGIWVGSSGRAGFYEYATGSWTVLEAADAPGEGIYNGQVFAIAQA